MPRPRPDPDAAGARLAMVLPSRGTGGWVPPPLPEPVLPEPVLPEPVLPEPVLPEPVLAESAPAEPVRSWSERPAGAAADQPGLLRGLVPATLRGGRWDLGRRGVGALAAVALVAALLAAAVVLRGRPQEITPLPVGGVPTEAAAGGAVVVVDVAGKVRRPGIVRLPLGSRVDDAVRAAGGPLPGATYDGLNRARKLTDGEQVLVGVPPAGASSAGSTGGGSDGRLDLNAADAAALDGLPGIGPVLAQKIVDWRTEHGRFASVDQLREVGGIGESKFAALKSKVRV